MVRQLDRLVAYRVGNDVVVNWADGLDACQKAMYLLDLREWVAKELDKSLEEVKAAWDAVVARDKARENAAKGLGVQPLQPVDQNVLRRLLDFMVLGPSSLVLPAG
jgi:hypothetical protein